MKIDVLLAVGYDPDARVRKETQALANAGHEVRILAWDRDGTRPLREHDGLVEIRRSTVRSTWGRGLTQTVYLARVAMDYLRLARRRRPDAIHAVDLPMLLVALLIRPFAGRPRIVYDAFEVYSLMVSHRMPRPVVTAIGLLERWAPRHATTVITPGEIRAAHFLAHGIHSVSVPNWSDPPVEEVDRLAARAALGIDSSRFVIAYAGALHPARDLDTLLRHAALAPDDVVLIAGQGPDATRLANVALDLPNVQFLGWLSDPAQLLAAADSLYYALRDDHAYAELAAPNNLYTAIANAIPIVYRAQGELGLMGARHEIGMAFTDAESLELAIDRLRPFEVRERIRRGLREIRDRYTWSRAAEALLAVYAANGSAARSETANGP